MNTRFSIIIPYKEIFECAKEVHSEKSLEFFPEIELKLRLKDLLRWVNG